MMQGHVGNIVNTTLGNLSPNTQYFVRLRASFDHLTTNSTVKIFTIAGHLVRELPAASSQSPAGSGQQVWDLKNDKGDPVASGIYIYVVTDREGRRVRGKLGVVR